MVQLKQVHATDASSCSQPFSAASHASLKSSLPSVNDPKTTSTPAEEFRYQVRANAFNGPSTSGVCAGYAQANLLILPKALASDFRLLCKRNPVPCPLIAETKPGDFMVPANVAANCDIRTDIPGYRIYEDGQFVGEVKSIEEEWKDDSVAFLIGCSQSFESVLISEGLTPRHIQRSKTVPMYKTKIPLCPAGAFSGHFVVSMRPYRPEQIEAVRNLTRPFVDTHGEPVAWGAEGAAKLGITDIMKPDFGDAPDFQEGEIPCFWGCGVTPQLAVMDSKIPGRVISHKPGSMLVMDLMDADVCIDL